jgi:hypothetical protein
MVTTAAACSTGGSDEKIALKGVKACDEQARGGQVAAPGLLPAGSSGSAS